MELRSIEAARNFVRAGKLEIGPTPGPGTVTASPAVTCHSRVKTSLAKLKPWARHGPVRISGTCTSGRAAGLSGCRLPVGQAAAIYKIHDMRAALKAILIDAHPRALPVVVPAWQSIQQSDSQATTPRPYHQGPWPMLLAQTPLSLRLMQ